MLQLRVEAIQWETADAATFFLSEVTGNPITYRAGQFITLLFSHHHREIRRSYSLSSAPGEKLLSITVKRIANGEISRFLLAKAKVGDIFTALEPAGKFTITDYQNQHDIVYFAAGSGITPIYAQIKFILAQAGNSTLTLVYSGRHPDSTLFYGELNKLANTYPESLRLIYLFSAGADGHPESRLNNKLVIDLITKNLNYDPGKASFYICGPFSYMRMVKLTLTYMGFESGQIRKENFVIEAAPQSTFVSYPPKTIKVNFGGTGYDLVVGENQSILDAAMQSGIHLPYSCKAGICSSCTAICKSGKIAMTVNDVLTDEDLKAGWILTCTGHPVSDDAVVEFL